MNSWLGEVPEQGRAGQGLAWCCHARGEPCKQTSVLLPIVSDKETEVYLFALFLKIYFMCSSSVLFACIYVYYMVPVTIRS